MARSGLLGAAVLTVAANELPAQRVSQRLAFHPSAHVARANEWMTSVPAPATSAGRPVAGALLGGAASVLIGGIAGALIGDKSCSTPGVGDTCRTIEGMLVGAEVGLTLGAPIGAHLLNRRQGSLPASLLGSAAVAGAGVAALWATGRLENDQRNNAIQLSAAVAIPVLQVVTAAIIEHRTSGQ